MKKKGRYTGTQYGRSYWPLYKDRDSQKYTTPYSYPTTTIHTKDDTFIRDADLYLSEFTLEANPVKTRAIYIDDLLSKI